MAKALPAELKDVVKSMFLAGLLPKAISQETGVSRRLISKWATLGKWRLTVSTAKDKMVQRGKGTLAKQAAADIGAASASVRSNLASVLTKQAAALDKLDPKAADLANTRDRQGQAAVAKSIMETARGVFGWGEESRPGMVLQVHLGAEPASKATTGSIIDVPAEVAEVASVDTQPVTGQLKDLHIVRNTFDGPAVRSDVEQGPPAAALSPAITEPPGQG